MIDERPSLFRASLWETWRTNWAGLIAPLAGQLVFALLFVGLRGVDRLSHDATLIPFVTGIFVMMAIVTSGFSHVAQNTLEDDVGGFPFRLGYTRPISTLRLVVVPMAVLLLSTPLIYISAVSFFNVMMGASAPLLKPSLLVLNAASILLAAAWIPVSRRGRAVVLLLCIAGFGASAIGFHYRQEHVAPFLMLVGTAEYFAFRSWHYLVLLVLPFSAMGATVLAVDRQRHGESFGAHLRWSRSGARRALGSITFRNRFTAQAWYEMRRFGSHVLVASIVAPLLPLILVHYVPRLDPNWQNAAMVWMIAIILCPIAYQISGAAGAIGLIKKDGHMHYSAFDATRPLVIAHMIWIKALVIAVGSLVGPVWMAIVASADSYFSGDFSQWSFEINALVSGLQNASLLSWITVFLSLLLGYLSTTFWMLAMGLLMPLHPGKFVAIITISLCHVFLALRDQHYGWQLAPLWSAYGWLLSVGILAGTLIAIRKAHVSRLLSGRALAIIVVIWVVYVATTLQVARDLVFSLPAPATSLALTSLLLPLAAFAIAPIALAGHRHA